MRRFRLTFRRGEELKYISHLDLLRTWVRALRRAGAPLAYSKGFNPHPKISLAAPLPVGVSGEAELMDIFVEGEPLLPELVARLRQQLPLGLVISQAKEVPGDSPSLPAALRAAEYRVRLAAPAPKPEFEQRLQAFLAAHRWPKERVRRQNTRCYDLRPLVRELRLEERGEERLLFMRLAAGPTGTARPEEVLEVLGLGWQSICRTQLVFAPSDQGQGHQQGHTVD